MILRLARAGDAAAIRHIYNESVLHSFATLDLRERTLEEQQAWLAARSGALAVVVAESAPGSASTLAGFGSLSPYRDRPGYHSTVEDSIYVATESRGRGVGRAVLTELIDVAAARGFHSVMARIIVADGHAASLALHESLGFTLIGTEREVGRKFGRWVDVLLLQRML